MDSKYLSSFTDTLNLCNFAKLNYLQMLSTMLLLLVILFLIWQLLKTIHFSQSNLLTFRELSTLESDSFKVQTAGKFSV